jgi:opacity protein-like surface antigen
MSPFIAELGQTFSDFVHGHRANDVRRRLGEPKSKRRHPMRMLPAKSYVVAMAAAGATGPPDGSRSARGPSTTARLARHRTTAGTSPGGGESLTTLSRLAVVMAFMTAAPLQAQSAHPPLHADPSLKNCSVRFASTLTQPAFHRFAREFGSVSAFKQVAPASTLGKGRVLIGIEMMSFTVDQWADAWNDTFAHINDHHWLGSSQSFPKLKLRAGVTDNLDVGAFYTRNVQSNYGWLGLDGKYRLLTESEDTPVSLAVRGAYTKTLYVGDMDMHALTADVSVDRTLWHVARPYVGLGADGVFVRETSGAVSLGSETVIAPHLFGGVDVTVWKRLNLGAEFTLGARPSAQVQIGGVVF